MRHPDGRPGVTHRGGHPLGRASASSGQDQPVPACPVQLAGGPGQHGRRVSGPHDHGVDPVQLLHGRLDCGLDLVGGGQVAHDRQRVVAGGGHHGQPPRLGVGQHHPRAALVKPPGRGGGVSREPCDQDPRGDRRPLAGLLTQVVERHRGLLLATDQQHELGQRGLAQLSPQPAPQPRVQLVALLQRVHRLEQQGPTGVPPLGLRAVQHARQVGLAQSDRLGPALEVAPQPVAAAVDRHPQRDQLSLSPRQPAAQAEHPGHPDSGREQAAKQDLAPRQSASSRRTA